MTLKWGITDTSGRDISCEERAIDLLQYYSVRREKTSIKVPMDLQKGDYYLSASLSKEDRVLAVNKIPLFVAPKKWGALSVEKVTQINTALYDPEETLKKHLDFLNIHTSNVSSKQIRVDYFSANGLKTLIIAPQADMKKLDSSAIDEMVQDGLRVLILEPTTEKWFSINPMPVSLFPVHRKYWHGYLSVGLNLSSSVVNIERPWHPIFDGMTRTNYRRWNCSKDWDGYSSADIGLVDYFLSFQNYDTFGAILEHAYPEDLDHCAVLANFGPNLMCVAMVEVFEGKGSYLVSAFNIISRIDDDPVAQKTLSNMISYMRNPNHEKHITHEGPIIFGNFESERGVICSPMQCLMVSKGIENKSQTAFKSVPLGRLIHRWQWMDNRVPNYELVSDTYDFINTGFFWIHYPHELNKIILEVENQDKKHKTMNLWVNDATVGSMKTVPGKNDNPNVTTTLVWDVSSLNIKDRDIKIALSGSTDLMLRKIDFQ
jgi:hypothetical protein